MPDQAPTHAIVGRVRKAHGLRGEIVVEPITSEPEAVFASGRRVLVGDAAGALPPNAPTYEVRRGDAAGAMSPA